MALYSVPQAAREADVSEKTVRQAIYEGELVAEKVGPAWVIDEVDLSHWMAQTHEEQTEEQDDQDE